ncbi:hypothetical protein JTB14_030583 [Gonioctena quinquepunctata]|nr:hypothetical protein JTB14_030583 [Gonioctena quinquepunctata]
MNTGSRIRKSVERTQKMTILQTNLGRNRAAHDAAFATVTDIDTDIIVVSEPNKKIFNGRGWYADIAKDVALYIRNNRICIQKIQKFEGYLTIEFPSFTLFSVYLSPNITKEDYRDKLENIMEKARRCQSGKIIAGDSNAKSAEWGSPTTDARGTILMDWTSTLNLIVQNRGSKPTFVRRATRSSIDVTLASQNIAKSITNWRVLDDETLTEHTFIEYNIGGKSANKNKYPCIIDWEACTTLMNWFTDGKIPPNLKEYNGAIRKIHQGCLIENDTKTSNVYWWNADIANKRKECTRHRREITRKRGNRHTNAREIEEAVDLYKTAKKELRKPKN